MGNTCAEDNSNKHNEVGLLSVKQQIKSKRVIEQVLTEINSLRRDPASYASKIERLYSKQFNGDIHTPTNVTYIEGRQSFSEAETLLRELPSRHELFLQKGLIASSFEHASFLAQTRTMSSVGRGGTHIKDRIAQFGVLQSDKVGECLIMVPTTDPVRVVIELLADDGIVDRRNRHTLLDPKFKYFGCASVKDSSGENYIVLNFAEEFRTDPTKTTEEILMKAELAANS